MTVVIILWKYFWIIFSNPACADIFERKNILSFFHEWGDIWICKQCQSVPSGCFPELWFMRFGYCICYHRPRKVIRQRGFPCRGPLPSLSSDILIFFLNIKREMCCEFSHMPLLFIIYLFMSVKVLCNALGAEIHIYIHSEPNRSNGHPLGSQVCNTHPVSRVCGFHLWGWEFPPKGQTSNPSLHTVGEDVGGEQTQPSHTHSDSQTRSDHRVQLFIFDN